MLGTETSFTQNWLLDLTYTGTKGTDLDLLRAPNRAPLGHQPAEHAKRASDSLRHQLLLRSVRRQFHLQRAAGARRSPLHARRFASRASTRIRKSLDNASSIGGTGGIVVQQDGNYAAERGLSSFDMRHQFRFTSTYELPFGERNRWANHGWDEKAFGNWRLLNNVTWHTGTPAHGLPRRQRRQQFRHRLEFLRARRSNWQSQFRNLRRLAARLFQHRRFRHAGCRRIWRRASRRHRRPVPVQLESLARQIGPLRPRAAPHLQCQLGNSESHQHAGLLAAWAQRSDPSTFGRITSAGSMRTMDIMIRFNL